MRASILPLLLLSLSVGCPTTENTDLDGDGFDAPEDCDDLDGSMYPGAGELCDGKDNDCDDAVDEGYDEDADGFNVCGPDTDCNDGNADAHPGAEEACDNVDNDCDGDIDEGCTSDGDGDGWYPPEDCDDSNADISPDAAEECDGVDNNCDGAVDEGFDSDGDGASYCNGVDCDDDDPAIHPGAAELCDGVDQDCDGAIDEDFDSDGDGWTTCHDPADCDDSDPDTHPLAPEACNGEDDDCDGAVDEDTADDLDGDGVSACNGDCDDSNPDVYPGGVEIPNGLDDDCSGAADDGYSGTMGAGLFSPQATGTFTAGRLGDVMGTAGFYDSDPLADMATGSPSHDDGTGRAYLLRGESFDLGSPPATLTPFATVTGAEEGDYLGHSVDLGDINGDGFDDWIIGAPELGSSEPPKGTVYIFFGEAVVSGGDWPTPAADVIITGGFPTEQCGTAVVAAGDLDGDLIGDLAFTCPWYNPGDGNLRGRTVVFFGRETWSTNYTSDQGDASIIGDVEDPFSGQALAGDFDLNGDGLADLAIGSPGYDGGIGRVGVHFGGARSSWLGGESFGDLDRLWFANTDHGIGSWLGSGDADGDVYGDLLVGSSSFAGDRGMLAVLQGGESPPSSGYFWNRILFYVSGDLGTELVGLTGALWDADGDGAPDLVVTTPGFDGPAGGDQGRLALFGGPLSAFSGATSFSLGDTFIVGEAGGDFFGGAVSAVPDFNGDGADDLLVSSPFSDAGAGNGGRVYFVPGF